MLGEGEEARASWPVTERDLPHMEDSKTEIFLIKCVLLFFFIVRDFVSWVLIGVRLSLLSSLLESNGVFISSGILIMINGGTPTKV